MLTDDQIIDALRGAGFRMIGLLECEQGINAARAVLAADRAKSAVTCAELRTHDMTTRVQLPTDEDQAAGMVLVGTRWLQDHAPHRLAQAKSEPAAQGWQPVSTMPRSSGGSYLVADAVRGMVAPHIRGVIHNNPGTEWDWQYGEAITHWMPLPPAPSTEGDAA